jgi:3-methylfumaryl-CoA hydratase
MFFTLPMGQRIMAEPSDTDVVRRTMHCDASQVRRVAAMLDLDPADFVDGALLPWGWHFFLLGGDTQRSKLRADAFPGFGIPMPDLGLPRLLLAGRTTAYRGDIRIGDRLDRRSQVQSITHKTGVAGPFAIVTLAHALFREGAAEPALTETQTYMLLGASKMTTPASQPLAPDGAQHRKTITPDATLLFQYSALGFNSHKIHIDRAWARDVEGLPDLVVNGGLASLLLTEVLRRDHAVTPTRISTRHTAPLYCDRPVMITAENTADKWRARAYDDAGSLAVDMEVEVS